MNLLSYFTLKAPSTLVYMLQQVEYNGLKFAKWAFGAPNLGRVQKRQTLHKTARAKVMLLISYSAWLLPLITGVWLVVWTGWLLFLTISLLAPVLCIFILFLSTLILQHMLVNPAARKEVKKAQSKLEGMEATRIAVLGSYGKTTMKELLHTVLTTNKRVAVTPGNKNVLVSHARWVNKEVQRNEDILVFEYGESETGDIAKLASFSKPEIAVVTGLAPAHMDSYPSLEAVADDLATIQDTVAKDKIYVNGASEIIKTKITGSYYTEKGLGDMLITDVSVSIEGVMFNLQLTGKKLSLKSGLLGRHQIGPLAAVVAIAHKFGLSDEQIRKGVSNTKPFEHRMQPYNLGGAWIIDDSYNGNIEGVRAGLALLKELSAKRKIYVTPGLVDQGLETENIHREMGGLIAAANPDKVILMQHSITPFIQRGLDEAGYKGEVKLESDPLNFYTSLEHFVANGDLVMLQNDWPDSYQ